MNLNSNKKLFQRDSGVLVHPTSLANEYGIGDFGPCVHRWLEILAEHHQNLWQILPLNPAGYGDSPYQGLSAFAANAVFLSPEHLFEIGLISGSFLESMRLPPSASVDYPEVYQNKLKLGREAQSNFARLQSGHWLREQYEAFLESESEWLDDFAIYYALKARFDRVAWTDWPEAFRDRDPAALDAALKQCACDIERAKLEQFLLRLQWDQIRATAKRLGIRIIGDLPIFVAHDSVDVWCTRELFRLNTDGSPSVMAGVPPDYFSKTGQLWGIRSTIGDATEKTALVGGAAGWVGSSVGSMWCGSIIFADLRLFGRSPATRKRPRAVHGLKPPGGRSLKLSLRTMAYPYP